MDTSEALAGESLHTCENTNCTPTVALLVVVGVPLAILALYKIHVDHERKQAALQAQKEKMEEYRKTKSGYVATLHHELIATRMDSDEQKMRQEDNQEMIRRRHKREINDLETKHRERERELKAIVDGIERQTKAQLTKEIQQSQERIKESEREVSSLRSKNKGYELMLENQKRTMEQQAEKYVKLSDKYSKELRQRNEKENALKKEKEQLEKDKNELQKELYDKEARERQLEEKLRHLKEQLSDNEEREKKLLKQLSDEEERERQLQQLLSNKEKREKQLERELHEKMKEIGSYIMRRNSC